MSRTVVADGLPFSTDKSGESDIHNLYEPALGRLSSTLHFNGYSLPEPYTKIVGELPQMRQEALILIKDAAHNNRRAYVLVNNRLEGNAPLTVQALTDLLHTAEAT